MSSSWSWFLFCSETRQMPFIMDDTFSATVLIKIESYLLGITLATLTLFDILMATEIAPMRRSPSFIMTKQPF